MTACLSLLATPNAFGFDPITALGLANSVFNAISNVGKGVEAAAEVSGTLGAMQGLFEEIHPNDGLDADAVAIDREIREVEGLALEAGYTQDDIKYLLSEDRARAGSLQKNLRYMTQLVRTGKQVYALAGRTLSKASQLASIESAQVQKRQLETENRILAGEIRRELDQKREAIRSVKSVRGFVRRELEYKSKLEGKSTAQGYDAMSIKNPAISEAVTIARSLRPFFYGLVIAILYALVAYNQVLASGHDAYLRLVRDTVVCCLLLSAFPSILEILFEVAERFSHHTAGLFDRTELYAVAAAPHGVDQTTEKSLTALFSTIWLSFKGLGQFYKAEFDSVLLGVVDCIRDTAYYFFYFVFTVAAALVIAMAPFFIVLATLLRLTIGLSIYFGMLVIVIFWPGLWNIGGALASRVWTSNAGPWASVCYGLVLFGIQIGLPWFLARSLRGTPAGAAVKSQAVAFRGLAASLMKTAGSPSSARLMGELGAGAASSGRMLISQSPVGGLVAGLRARKHQYNDVQAAALARRYPSEAPYLGGNRSGETSSGASRAIGSSVVPGPALGPGASNVSRAGVGTAGDYASLSGSAVAGKRPPRAPALEGGRNGREADVRGARPNQNSQARLRPNADHAVVVTRAAGISSGERFSRIESSGLAHQSLISAASAPGSGGASSLGAERVKRPIPSREACSNPYDAIGAKDERTGRFS